MPCRPIVAGRGIEELQHQGFYTEVNGGAVAQQLNNLCSNERISHQNRGGVVAVRVFETGVPKPIRKKDQFASKPRRKETTVTMESKDWKLRVTVASTGGMLDLLSHHR